MQVESGFDPGIFTVLRKGGICSSGDLSLDPAATLTLQNIYIAKDHVFTCFTPQNNLLQCDIRASASYAIAGSFRQNNNWKY